MIEAKINKAELEKVKDRLAKARASLIDDNMIMRQIAVYLDQWVQRNFQSGGGKVGGWKPFTYGGRIVSKGSATGYNKGHWINSSAKLLLDTTTLRHSFLPFIGKGSAGIGSDLPYSKTHDEGLNGLPQRRLLPVSREVLPDIKRIVGNHIAIVVRRTNGA